MVLETPEMMVVDTSQRGSDPAANGGEFEIVDETSAEQVEREQTLLAPVEQGESTTDPQARLTPESDPDTEPIPQPGSSPGDPEQSQVDPKQIRTYSQNEVSKMQAAWARQIEGARKTAVKAGEQLQQFNMDAAVEALLKKQVSELAPGVGAEKAEQMVRTPQNAELVRRSIADQQLLRQSEAEKTQAIEQQEDQARFIVAQALAREHAVAPEDFDLLAAASTPKAMQSLARRLGGEGPAALRDRVPPETQQTQLENGYHAGPPPESADRRLERIRAKPSWEWTEADLRYMKTGEVR